MSLEILVAATYYDINSAQLTFKVLQKPEYRRKTAKVDAQGLA